MPSSQRLWSLLTAVIAVQWVIKGKLLQPYPVSPIRHSMKLTREFFNFSYVYVFVSFWLKINTFCWKLSSTKDEWLAKKFIMIRWLLAIYFPYNKTKFWYDWPQARSKIWCHSQIVTLRYRKSCECLHETYRMRASGSQQSEHCTVWNSCGIRGWYVAREKWTLFQQSNSHPSCI